MSARQWKPGDAVIVEWFAGDGPVLMFRTTAAAHCPSHHPRGEHWHSAKNTFAENIEAAEWVRPLVVIDPEDREQVERLIAAYSSQPRWHTGYTRDRIDAMQAALHEFVNPAPPKPDEPTGLGAVVEDADGDLWVKVYDRGSMWQHNHDRDTWHTWERLDAVRVVSEGVAQ